LNFLTINSFQFIDNNDNEKGVTFYTLNKSS
jgi:hypothetical protein